IENASGNPDVLYVVLILIAVVPVLSLSGKLITKKEYPIAIGAVSLALLWQYTLVSGYIVGWDVNLEYYFAGLVQSRGFWDPSLSGTVNSMLSITVLAPAFSGIMGLDLVWVIKVVYPCFFALVPVILFRAYRNVFVDRIAFFV